MSSAVTESSLDSVTLPLADNNGDSGLTMVADALAKADGPKWPCKTAESDDEDPQYQYPILVVSSPSSVQSSEVPKRPTCRESSKVGKLAWVSISCRRSKCPLAANCKHQ